MIDALMPGMTKLYRGVSTTMGAAGTNSTFRRHSIPLITNDGISIADRLNLEDEAEALGADLLRQAAKRTDEEAGDGTSTAITLGYTMVQEGLKKIKNGAIPMKLRREIEQSSKKVIEAIKSKSRVISSDEELFNIANISMENPEIATIVRDAVKRSGPDGTVIVDESTGIKVEKEEIDGMRFDKGYISPYMITNPEKMEAVLENVHVLITDKNLNSNNDMMGLLEELASKRKIGTLFVIADDLSGELLATVIANRMKQNGFHLVCVKKPYFRESLEDIAILTGAKALTSDTGIQKFTAENFADLGLAKKIIVTKDSCVIIGAGEKAKVDERIASIKVEMEKTDTPYEKNKLKDRLAKLVGGVVVIKVGAPTEAEMKYLKLKIDDSVNATKAAMEEGIVIGGGRTLYDISRETPENDGDEVVKKALAMPIRMIIQNAGENADVILATLKEGEIFNALTGKVCTDPIAEGIIDPTKVERCAVANAASFAGLFLTTGSAIIDIPEKLSDLPPRQ